MSSSQMFSFGCILVPRVPPVASHGVVMRFLFLMLIMIQLVVMLPTSPASAQQSPVCGQIRAEIAGLSNDRSGSGDQREAQRLRGELGRIRLALQQNDCNRGGFVFFTAQPPVCPPLKAQAAQYEGRIRQLEGGAGGANAQRRAQLIAALDRYGCNGAPPQQRGVIYATPNAPSLFDQLFGGRQTAPVEERPEVPRDAVLDEELERKAKLGGRTAVCVRTCDGFFFPVNYEGLSARDEHESVCKSLCPAAETQVFYMRLGADIDTAASRSGQPYTSLPMAMKYRESRVSDCACKAAGQTWAQAMAGLEDLVEARKGDVIVTPEQAQAMSRPKGLPAPTGKNTPKQKAALQEPEPQALPESALPTGGSASSGIGPKSRSERTLGTNQGQVQDIEGADGTKRHVRIVTPNPTAPEPQPALRGAKQP